MLLWTRKKSDGADPVWGANGQADVEVLLPEARRDPSRVEMGGGHVVGRQEGKSEGGTDVYAKGGNNINHFEHRSKRGEIGRGRKGLCTRRRRCHCVFFRHARTGSGGATAPPFSLPLSLATFPRRRPPQEYRR